MFPPFIFNHVRNADSFLKNSRRGLLIGWEKGQDWDLLWSKTKHMGQIGERELEGQEVVYQKH